jgi:nucleotide-binding universal stress UspA family protein
VSTFSRPQPGVVIDGFRLETRLHQGSMSTLWRVTAEGRRGAFAMKIPLLRDYDDPAAIVGFEVEQMILPTLSGAHVPRFVAAGDFSTQPYIVVELIEGASLRPRLDEAPLPAIEVAALGARIATALHDIHSQHVIHLDVKPSNVMFRESGEAVLIDFGLSRHDRLPDLLAEEFRLPMGTAPYIAPEQVLRIRNEPRSDVFALGVLLYHLATGVRPFGNPTTVRGLRRRLYRDPFPPSSIRRDLPKWLQEILLRCLEVDPANRWDSAGQLAFQLQHPEQVELTARAWRTVRDPWGIVSLRWLRTLGWEPDPRQSAAGQVSRAPIVVVAVDLASGSESLLETLRDATRRVLVTESHARLACVTVLKSSRIGMDIHVDAQGRNLHVRRLVELKHWARPLDLPPERITYHVLESPDVGAGIVEFASTNHVDHVVIGSRGASTFRRYLGSVSSQVVAQAPCTVTVVKTPDESSTASEADAERDPGLMSY